MTEAQSGTSMTRTDEPPASNTHKAVLTRVRELTAGFRDRAAAAEQARTLPKESVDALLGAGITRILIPPRFGATALASIPGSRLFARSPRPTPRTAGVQV